MKEQDILKRIYQWTDRSIMKEFTDHSMRKRRNLIEKTAERMFSQEFLEGMNGTVFPCVQDREYSVIACSVFLDDVCVKNLLSQQKEQNIFLLTHHFFDIDCGRPGTCSGTGFSMINIEKLRQLYDRGVQICSIHLPLDVNKSVVNTHRALTEQLGLVPEKDLLEYPFGTIGYMVNGSMFSEKQLRKMFPDTISYGNVDQKLDLSKKIAVIAGMISSTEMLQRVEKQNCGILICGDVLLRNGSRRTKQIEEYISQTSLKIYCISHYQSEFWALKRLTELVAGCSDMLPLLIYDKELWK